MTDRISFRWGVPILDDRYVPVYTWMLHNYARAGVTREEFLLIIHLAEFHYETPNGESRPGLETIREYMGYAHVNSVYRLRDQLVEKGLLRVTKRHGRTDVYDVKPFSERLLALWEAERAPLHSSVGVDLHSSVGAPLHPSVDEEKELRRERQKGVVVDTRLKNLTEGVADETLNELVERYGLETVMEYAEWYAEGRRAGKVKGPGWLRSALENGWKPAQPAEKRRQTGRKTFRQELREHAREYGVET